MSQVFSSRHARVSGRKCQSRDLYLYACRVERDIGQTCCFDVSLSFVSENVGAVEIILLLQDAVSVRVDGSRDPGSRDHCDPRGTQRLVLTLQPTVHEVSLTRYVS